MDFKLDLYKTTITDLPMHIIWYIQKYLDSNLDRIMMLLTNRLWFENRDEILRFSNLYHYKLKFENLNIFKIDRSSDEDDLFSFGNLMLEDENESNEYFYNISTINYNFESKDTAKTYTVEGSYQMKTIPKDTIYLIFGRKFNSSFYPGEIPNSVQHITFGKKFNKSIYKDSLPSNLKSLKFGENFNSKIESIPLTLETLEFGHDFNYSIYPNMLPQGLKTLKFGCFYQSEIQKNSLPDSLQSLSFGPHYRHPFDFNNLPPNLQYMSFYRFVLPDKPVVIGTLPDSLQTVEMAFNNAHCTPYGFVEYTPQFYKKLRNILQPHTNIKVRTKDTNLEVRHLPENGVYLLNNDSKGGFISNRKFILSFLKINKNNQIT